VPFILPPHLISPVLHGSTQVVRWVIRKTNSAADPLPAISIDIATEIQLEGTQDEFIVLDQSQFEEIQEFLADPTITSLFRLSFIQRLAPADAFAYINEIANLRTFQRLAQDWCKQRSQTWSDLAEHLWLQTERSHELLVKRLRDSQTLTEEVSDSLIDRFFFGRPGDSSAVPEHIRLINELAQNKDRQHRIADFLYDCARRTKTSSNDEFLILGLQEDRAKFDDLYVDRTLIDADTGETVFASRGLDIQQSCPRVVVIGDPGVGKSTLTSWIRWKMFSSATRMPFTPSPVAITIISRYDLVEPNSTIMAAIRKHFETDFLIECDEKLIGYLAATGWITLIVDGIDEISDSNQRRKVVDQINSIAEVYPALAIVCTTRRTGFEVSVFRTPPFTILQLDNYSQDQIAEYAHKWFSGWHSNLKAERFLGESRTLGELIRNPLLLALLCTLYRQYDYIPESRRELYLRCAALMFYEWDPRRGIAIPNLFKREGEAILREIALILMRKGGVGASIDESQLLIIIKGHLEDKGLDSVAAVAAARELLEYCSRRAWILSKVGSKAQLNYFSFTHRTFFEFFAAEALIRKLNHQHALAVRSQGTARDQGGDLGPVSRTILDTFLEDPTTVMPELLLQTADDLMGGMSTPILDELLRVIPRTEQRRRADITALCVRLVVAGGAHVGIVDRVLDSIDDTWPDLAWPGSAGKSGDVLSDFRALLNITPSHRARFSSRCINDSNNLGRRFLQRYARLSMIGESGLYSDEWRECALRIMNSDSPVSKDPFEIKYRWQNGLLGLEGAVRPTSGENLLLLTTGDHAIEGILWDALAQGEASGTNNKILMQMFQSIADDNVLLESNIGDRLVIFAEHARVADELTVPRRLAQIVALLMPRGEVAHWARITKRPELLAFDKAISELGVAYRLRRRVENSSSKKGLAKARSEYASASARYARLFNENPPMWLLHHLSRV
jgi:hypothetical protein